MLVQTNTEKTEAKNEYVSLYSFMFLCIRQLLQTHVLNIMHAKFRTNDFTVNPSLGDSLLEA